jgi:hypothetical protein
MIFTLYHSALLVHVCGEPSVEELVRKMCEETGDDVEVIRYVLSSNTLVLRTSSDTHFCN